MIDPEPLLALATTIPGAGAVGLVLAAVGGSIMHVAGKQSARHAAVKRLTADPMPAVRSRPTGDTAPKQQATPTPAPAKPGLADKAIARANMVARLIGPKGVKQIRHRLMRAGFFEARAVPLFFMARAALAAVVAAATPVVVTSWKPEAEAPLVWLFTIVGMTVGWLLPSLWLDRRTKAVTQENRQGFPDFMDLMGVCANAGLSMEASLERVARELADMYPVLGVQLQILCLEVRAGRPLEEALHGLADRLDIAEVRAFATLLQQSKELGSSLSDALRVFSDDMRHKRLSMAEEKAYALPAKMSVPVTVCILPVVIIVAIIPVVVKFRNGIY